MIQILVIGLKKWSIRKIGELYNVLVQFINGFIFDCTGTCNSHMPLWTLDFPNRLVSLIPVSSWFLCVVLTVKQCLWLPLDGTAVCHRLTPSIRRCCNMYNYSACLSFLVMSCHAIQLKIFSQRLLSFNSECGQIFC